MRLTVALLLLGAIAGCSALDGTPREGATPSALEADMARPDIVLTRYLDALVVGDCARAHSFVGPTFVKGNGELCGSVDVSAFSPLSEPAHPNETEYVYSTTLLTSGSADGSIQPGSQLWFYDLLRQADGRWLIRGGGSGP